MIVVFLYSRHPLLLLQLLLNQKVELLPVGKSYSICESTKSESNRQVSLNVHEHLFFLEKKEHWERKFWLKITIAWTGQSSNLDLSILSHWSVFPKLRLGNLGSKLLEVGCGYFVACAQFSFPLTF